MVDLINWSGVTDLSGIPDAANTASGGSFWVGMLYMLWILLIVLFSAYGLEVALLVASFLSLIIGLLMVYGGLVAWIWIMPLLATIIITFLYLTYQRSKM